jgi:hypothetical protein
MDVATDRRAAQERSLRILPTGLRILGATWGGFFVFLLISPLLGLTDEHDLWARATLWGHGFDDSTLMICVMNIVLGAFLVLSARDPRAYRSFLDFALAMNAAHQGLMLVLGFVRIDTPIHLVTDIPAGVGHTVLFALLWLPARSALAAPPARPAVAHP